jgi:hypothetical protein
MADRKRRVPPEQAPDPSYSYERSHPSRESGMGKLDSNKGTPLDAPDRAEDAAPNRQDPARQVNAQDTVNPRGAPTARKSKPKR